MKSRAGCVWRLKFCLSAENNPYSLLFCSGLDPKLSFSLVLTLAVAAVRMLPVCAGLTENKLIFLHVVSNPSFLQLAQSLFGLNLRTRK